MWYEELIQMLDKTYKVYYLVVITSGNSWTPKFYREENSEITYDDQFLELRLHKIYNKELQALMEKPGIHIYVYRDGVYVEAKYIRYFNRELFDTEAAELTLFQVYGVKPSEDKQKEELEKSIKAEKIKNTLVYACYENDIEKIRERVKGAKPSQLNKMFKYVGTPLTLCAERDNLEGFKLIAEAGADVGKSALGSTPLGYAFCYSPDIVKYIYENYKDQFDKEVKKKGFSIASRCQSLKCLQLLKDYGCDMVCEGAAFPPAHNFVDHRNWTGLKFLIDEGVKMNIKNIYKQTPMDRAIRWGYQDIAEFLSQYM